MKTKLIILLSLMLLCINSAFSQTQYKVPAKDTTGKVIQGKWIPMSEEELKKHQDFKKGAEKKAEKPVEIVGGLVKQITTWTKGDSILVETHTYDPKKVIAQKGYKPVDVTFVTTEK